ncbi:MAG TPA: hypothetical protein VJS44_15855 [Pyrinomonadaceae bacterium]|nr:hypothetical protein [Pyrinomonadaceae bacterium]
MRCLNCGIRLKIAEKGQVIEHCPECSMRAEYESRRDFKRAQDVRSSKERRTTEAPRFQVAARSA